MTHSSILAWRTLWTEEPSGLQQVGAAKKSPEARFKEPEKLIKRRRLERRLGSGSPAHTLILSETPSLIHCCKKSSSGSLKLGHSFFEAEAGVSLCLEKQ